MATDELDSETTVGMIEGLDQGLDGVIDVAGMYGTGDRVVVHSGIWQGHQSSCVEICTTRCVRDLMGEVYMPVHAWWIAWPFVPLFLLVICIVVPSEVSRTKRGVVDSRVCWPS